VKKNKASKAWIHEHINDAYVQRAQVEGWRSRAAFKLIEIDDKYHLLKRGMAVVDLGSTPGSWSQVASKRIQPDGFLAALDILEMEPLHNVHFIHGDFREESVLGRLEAALAGRRVDLVLSDMAPNMSGIALADQAQVMHLAELALEFSRDHLKPGGNLLVKVFQGFGFMEFREVVKAMFEVMQVLKPAASRNRSAEIYLLARRKRPN
jgi:23S rRNA (uridine2552-2'-O)-methyltransferase